MEIILKEDIFGLGKAGMVVKVKSGHARNFLIPRGLGLEVTNANLKVIEHQRKLKEQKSQEIKQQAQDKAKKLESVSCTISMNAGEDDKLFGAVTTADIAEALNAEGVVVDKKDIVLAEDMNKLGIYHVTVKLHSEVTQQLKVWVVKK